MNFKSVSIYYPSDAAVRLYLNYSECHLTFFVCRSDDKWKYVDVSEWGSLTANVADISLNELEIFK